MRDVWSLWGLLAPLVVVACAFLFRPGFFKRPLSRGRRLFLGALQAIPLLGLCWLLANPFGVRNVVEKKTSMILFLVDDSSSMGTAETEDGSTRLDLAEGWVEEALSGENPPVPKDRTQVRRLSELLPEGRSGSDFSSALEQVARRFPKETLSGIVFISDGRDRGPRSPIGAARALGVPIHAAGIGPEAGPDSVRVSWTDVPKFAQPGSPFSARWRIQSNLAQPLPARISIQFASEETRQESLDLDEGSFFREGWVSVASDNVGTHELRIEVRDASAKDLLGVATASLTVDEKPLTALLLESAPTRLTRSLSQALLADGRYRVLRPVGLPEGGGVLWEPFRPLSTAADETVSSLWEHEKTERYSAEEWEGILDSRLDEVSVLVLGNAPWKNLPERGVADVERLTNESPLGLLALPGSEIGRERLPDPEGSLARSLDWMSAREESRSPLAVRFPEEAAEDPALAPLRSELGNSRQIGPNSFFNQVPTGARILIADRGDRPLAVRARFGLGGEAILVAPSNLWTLKALASSDRDARFLEGLWVGFIDHLARKDLADRVTLSLDPEIPSLGQSVRIVARDPSLRPGGNVGGLEMRRKGEMDWSPLLLAPSENLRGIAECVWVPRESGEYELRYGESATRVTRVLSRPSEKGDTLLDAKTLRSLSEETGGVYRSFADRNEILDELEISTITRARRERRSLRHDAAIGAALAALFCLGWAVRRYYSLP